MGSSVSVFKPPTETDEKIVVATSVEQACQWLTAGFIIKHNIIKYYTSDLNSKMTEVYFVIDRFAFNHNQHQHQVSLDLLTTVHCQPKILDIFLEQLKSVGYTRLNSVCWDRALRLRLCEIPETEFATEVFPTFTACGSVVNYSSEL